MIRFLDRFRTSEYFKTVIGIGFGFLLLVSFIIVFVTFFNKDQTKRYSRNTELSRKVINQLSLIPFKIIEGENSERSFAITGKEESLHSFRESKRSIRQCLLNLRRLTAENSNQQIRLTILEPLIRTRLSLLDEIVESSKKKGYSGAMDFESGGSGKMIMGSIANVIENMIQEEQQILFINEQKIHKLSANIEVIILSSSIITLLVIAGLFLYLMSGINAHLNLEKELKSGKEKAENLIKVKDQFFANISHEIRTPMNAILGLSRILLKTNPKAKQKEYLEAVKTSADIVIAIINDILDLSKAQAGKMEFEQNDFRLADLTSIATEVVQSKAIEKNIALHNDFDGNIPDVIVGDSMRLNQILINLLSNAIKFTETGEVRLMTSLVGLKEGRVVIKFAVKDTGIGIPQDKLNSIFDEFTQANNQITKKYGGTGLGLKIAKEFVERQGGKITVTSELNKGSVFSFTLSFPISDNQDLPQVSAPIGLDHDLGKVKVLLVEDNAINQLVASTVLTDFGFISDVAENGKVALEKIQREVYDIILMDVQMPEMDGYEVTGLIRKKKYPINKIPILAMTANAGKTDADKCIAAGMNDFISKPFDEKDLHSKIVKLVKSYRHQASANLSSEGSPSKINLEYLRSLSKGNTKFMYDVIELFVKQTPIAIENMKQGLSSSDWKSLVTEAHKLRPSFNFVGLKEMENSAKQIEQYAERQEKIGLISDLVMNMQTVCNRVYIDLKHELHKINSESEKV